MDGVVERDILRQSAANPEIAFLQLRHELPADYPKQRQRNDQECNGRRQHEPSPPHQANEHAFVVMFQPMHQPRVGPVSAANASPVGGQYGSKNQGEDERAGEGKSIGYRHRRKDPSRNSLHGKQRDKSNQNNKSREEYGFGGFRGGF